MISSGTQAEAARFLTGAPAREFTSNTQTPEELQLTLSINLNQNFIVTAACFVEHQGLLPGQGYIVKSYLTLAGQSGKDVTLIKVKNPFKKSEINV